MLQLRSSLKFDAEPIERRSARKSTAENPQRYVLGRFIPRDPELGATVLGVIDLAVFLASIVFAVAISALPSTIYLQPENLYFFVTSVMCFLVAQSFAQSYRGQNYFRILRVSRAEFALVPALVTGVSVIVAIAIKYALFQAAHLGGLMANPTQFATALVEASFPAFEFTLAGVAAGFICFERLLIIGYLRNLQSNGYLATQVVLFGATDIGKRLMRLVREDYHDSVKVLGIYDDRIDRVPAEIDGIRVEEGMHRLIEAVQNNPDIEKVLIALPMQAEQRILDLLQRLRHLDVDVALVPELIGVNVHRLRNRNQNRAAYPQMLDVGRRAQSAVGRVAKRSFDIVAAGLLLVALSPLFALVALAIRLDSKGPIFFLQPRMGFNNREFSVFKFRSMYADQADFAARQQTRRNDSRITTVGAILRRTSIDELPQLINVLRGDMSLVGPRPHALGMQVGNQLCDEIVREYAVRHRVKPGITGWAQVRGLRGAIEEPELLVARVQHDIYYIDNWSFFFDLRILILTAVALVRTRNAF